MDLSKLKSKIEEKEGRLVHSEKGCLIFEACSHYRVPTDRCKNFGEILSWVIQLQGKPWMTIEIQKAFIQMALKANGLSAPNL